MTARLSMRDAINDRYEVDTEGRVYSLARPVPAYISRGGEVKSWRIKPERELTLQRHTGGYLVANIGDKRHYVHRLVATTFLPNPNGLCDVNHIDGDKTNNCVKNLEWATRAANLRHALETGLRKPKTKVTVAQIERARKLIGEGASQQIAAAIIGVSQAYLSMLLRDKYELKYAQRT